MKTKVLAALSLLLLVAACTTVEPAPTHQDVTVLNFAGKKYLAIPFEIDVLSVGDLVAYRVAGQLTASKVLSKRGVGVYRVEGDDLVLVSATNYVGKMYLAE